MQYDHILLEHGSGGLLSHDLVRNLFLPLFRNEHLSRLEDAATFCIGSQRFCLTTDSYVVHPLFFPGGDIGSLAVHGTVNDIAMSGGRPLFLSAGFIIEEGFPYGDLQAICRSMAAAAESAGVEIVTGDTKVVPRGAADGLFINTSGIGIIEYSAPPGVACIRPGDVIIVNGPVGDHGAAILQARQSLGFKSAIISDSAPLNGLVAGILESNPHIHCMRDATRGGLGGILAEMAEQSGLVFILDEAQIPIHEDVRAICEMLGLDPLYLANEGKMVLFCPATEADSILSVMKNHSYGREGAVIGRVKEGKRGRLILQTTIGGSREIDLPTGELIPRIC